MKEAKISFYEEQIYGEKEKPKETKQYCLFRLSTEWYAIESHSVKRVTPLTPISPLPAVPDHILGMINFRGEVLSATDIKKILDLKEETSQSIKSRFVMIEHGSFSTALFVDGDVETVDIPIKDILSRVVTLQDEKSDCIDGEVHFQEKLVAILNAPKILERTKVGYWPAP